MQEGQCRTTSEEKRPLPPTSEKDPSEDSSAKQTDKDEENVKEESTEGCKTKVRDPLEVSLTEDASCLKTEDNVGVMLPKDSQAPSNESKEKMEQVEATHQGNQYRNIREVGLSHETVQLKEGSVKDQDSRSKTYFETSKNQDEGLSQGYYELSLTSEKKSGVEYDKTRDAFEEQEEKKVRTLPDKAPLEQRRLSLNIPTGSSTETTVNIDKSRRFSESLCPISGSFDGSDVPPLTPFVKTHALPFQPVLSITPTSDCPQTGEDISAEEHGSSSDQSESLSDMLDLAGVPLRPPIQMRDHIRRKSMPASAFLGNTFDKLGLSVPILTEVAGENQQEDLGYCMFSEYSAPMPSPADLPSPGDPQHQHFPSLGSVEQDDSRVVETEGGQIQMQPNENKEMTQISQKPVLEKKDPPVKTSLILDKAVTSGVKPDRLRIPMTASKDRLTELRLETGLPGDIKIQAIPEVDVEKDPSREASPIPPDNSFTFTPAETGSRLPLNPTSPKSSAEGTLETQVSGRLGNNDMPDKSSQSKTGAEELEANKGMEKSDVVDQEEIADEQDRITKARLSASSDPFQDSVEDKPLSLGEIETPKSSDLAQHSNMEPVGEKTHQIQLPEVNLTKDSAKPQILSPIIVIPQAQVDEEDDIEIAEEPQEIMGEPEESLHSKRNITEESIPSVPEVKEQKKDQMRLMVCDKMLDDDSKSGAEEWSHSALNSDEGEPATDSSHLSPRSDHDLLQQSEEGDEEENKGKDFRVDTMEGTREENKVVSKEETCQQKAERAGDGKEKKIQTIEDGTKGKYTAIDEEASSLATNDETTVDVSIMDSDSGWMDPQGTQNLYYVSVLQYSQSS